jgi:hypothetical protein
MPPQRDNYKPIIATLDTVYDCLTGQSVVTSQWQGTTPTMEVNGGSINMYVSNALVKPVDKTEMTLDSLSPFVEDVYNVKGQVKFLLFELVSGTPEVKTLNLIK